MTGTELGDGIRRVYFIAGGAKPKHFDPNVIHNPLSEVWGINAIRPKWVPRWHRMFNLHLYELLVKYKWPVHLEIEWHQENPDCRMILADRWPDKRMTDCEIFPKAKLAGWPRGEFYHCNSIDWLIAYALQQGFHELHLHGATLARDGMMEQMSARACAEYWAGYAEALGMKVVLAPDSDLFTAYHLVRSNRLYGYEDCPPYEDRVTGKDPPFTYDEGY